MNCPVCNHTELSEDTTSCPQCHSDIEVFNLIVEASEQRSKNKKIISALSIFAAVTAIGWASVGVFSGGKSAPVEVSPEIPLQGEIRTTEDSALISMLNYENEALKSENALLKAKANTVAEKPVVKAKPVAKEKSASKTSASATETQSESGTIIHTVRNGDTFWIIAKKYYKDGRKYKQIAKDNGLSVKSKLRKGQKIKIVNS